MQLAVDDEEDVGAGRLGDLAAPVEHQRVMVAGGLRLVLRQGADHVQAGRLRMHRRRARIGPPPVGNLQLDPFGAGFRIEVGRPLPHGDGDVDRVGLGRHAHHLGAAPGDRADVAVGDLVAQHHLAVGGVDLVDRVGDLEVQQPRRVEQPLGVVLQMKDLAVVDALALEHAGRIVQTMRQHMHLGILPRQHLAVEPDGPVELVVCDCCHMRLLRDTILPVRRGTSNIPPRICQHC